MAWSIIDKLGNEVCKVHSLQYNGDWMEARYITVDIKSAVLVDLTIGCYIDYNNERYYLRNVPSRKKNSRRGTNNESFNYDGVRFDSVMTELEDCMMFDYIENANGEPQCYSGPNFVFYGSIKNLAERISINLKRKYGDKWTIDVDEYVYAKDMIINGVYEEAYEEFAHRENVQEPDPSREREFLRWAEANGYVSKQSININSENCLKALNKVNDTMFQDEYGEGAGYYIDLSIENGEPKRHIVIGRHEGTICELGYGKGKGLTNIEKKTDPGEGIITRLYAYGNQTNMPMRYYNELFRTPYIDTVRVPLLEGTNTLSLMNRRAGQWVSGWEYVPITFSNRDFVKPMINKQKIDFKLSDDRGWEKVERQKEVRVIEVSLTEDNSDTVLAIVDYPTIYITNLLNPYFEYTGSNINPRFREFLSFLNSAYHNSEKDDNGNAKIDRLFVREGVETYLWDSTKKMTDNDNIAYHMSMPNLMLPGWPKENKNPYVDTDRILLDGTPAIEYYGIREGVIKFDGSGDTEDVHPTIKGILAEDLISAGYDIRLERFDDGHLDRLYRVDLTQSVFNDTGVPSDYDTPLESEFEIELKDIGFDISDHVEDKSVNISFTSGMLQGRSFEIVGDIEEVNRNVYGKDVRSWKLRLRRDQDSALQNMYFPNKFYKLYPGDTFVITDITMPKAYIDAASWKLKREAMKKIRMLDHENVSYSLSVDNIYFANQHDEAIETGGVSLHDTMREGMKIQIYDEDLEIDVPVTIDKLSVKEGNGIPSYEITLRNEKYVGSYTKLRESADRSEQRISNISSIINK